MSEILTGRMAVKARQIRPGQGYAVEVEEGHLLQITDVKGKQVADFVAFARDDRDEFLSVAHTRSANTSIMLRQGMRLYSNRRRPLFELVEDTVGRHDLLFAACDPRRYEELEAPDHASCRVALTEALTPLGVPYDRIPDPVNWFMNVAILQLGELEVRPPISERNDYVLLRALTDVVAAVSACPQELNATNNFAPSDLLIRVYR
jgi:uncharacterized protein YcgI (DUF1989 family)